MRIPAVEPYLGSYADAVYGLKSGFFYFPILQAREWGLAEQSVLEHICVALALGHFHYSWQDKLIDEAISDPIMCLCASEALMASIDLVCDIDPHNTRDYRRMNSEYYARYTAAVLRDLAHRVTPHSYTADELLTLGEKAAPGGTVIRLIGSLTGHEGESDAVVEALILFCAGLQLVDDLGDAAIDAADGNLSWPVTSAIQAYPDLDRTNAEQVDAAVVGSGAEVACLRLATSVFTKVQCRADAISSRALCDLANAWRERTHGRLLTAEARVREFVEI
ncbi:hypothetical protein MAAFP003_87 [Mycobacterium ahvazicum]|uniref:Polyprenyl synthetase n=2 Tax=Mycobacterium ahvazicum TaxID=1964395 RepID=A0A2K4Y3V3_9MYCO|nr:hypothetical protein MAAFP003_87 [Mycobacterium ahvazicum]